MIAYRFAHLLLPLQDVRNGMITGELDVTVEHNTLAKDGGNVNGILGGCGRRRKKGKIELDMQ